VTMGCKVEDSLLQEYLDGMLDPLETLLLEEHVRICPECQVKLEQLKEVYGILASGEEEYPLELELLHLQVLKKMEPAGGFGMKELAGLGRAIGEVSTRYLDFVPGCRKGQKLVRSLVRRAPGSVAGAVLELAGRRSLWPSW